MSPDPAKTPVGRGAARTRAILDVTRELLGEVGFDQLSIDAVAARAGSSKTTIYRRWADKSELVRAALLARGADVPLLPADARDLRTDLLRLVEALAHIAREEDAAAFASLLAAAQKDAAIAEAVRVSALDRARQDCRDVVQRAIGRGELADPALAARLFDLVMGQVMVSYVLGTGDLDAPRREAFVDEVLVPVLTRR
ncbi:TetR/AcrR family transcriptional regulator [Actinomadura rayongensis]|uniref:TetR family transcriptional regulator n=1 Tax=Actinomadura rayongensis TaxID=1429076 RepID=A0A6I4W7W8_9ACTN|nr:TetR/AcrR family transcriptional regulator [Actinomadura rayongensis]MXQ64296.1 TetR family transcriptional regulator [Actinomadura rayongensis]